MVDSMSYRAFWFTLIGSASLLPGARAESTLLTKAIQQWTAGPGNDLAFTRRSGIRLPDGTVKEERLERYDPSLPDFVRWRLIEVDGRPATPEEREGWESKKNGKPRKKAFKPPAEYLDVEGAKLVDESAGSARFEIPVKPETARLVTTDNISILLTIDKETASIAGITATLRQPIRILLGLVRVTELKVDVRLELADEKSPGIVGEVKIGSTARVAMAKLGKRMEYTWTEFKRVPTFPATKASDGFRNQGDSETRPTKLRAGEARG